MSSLLTPNIVLSQWGAYQDTYQFGIKLKTPKMIQLRFKDMEHSKSPKGLDIKNEKEWILLEEVDDGTTFGHPIMSP